MKVGLNMRPLIVLAAVAMMACVDSGLPDTNLPLEEARVRAPSYGTYDAALNVQPVHFDGRDWMAAGPAASIADHLLVAVEGADHEVFALATDSPPYTRLYHQAADGFTPLAPTPTAGTGPPAETGEHH